jgi:hypothetical protein
LVLSAHTATNDVVFEQLMTLHVPVGATVADVTYGKGCFWKRIPEGRYNLKATDLKDGVDCRKLPYADATLDCVILDPPYMEGFYRRKVSQLGGNGSHANLRTYYGNHTPTEGGEKWHGAVRAIYRAAAKEACRVLKNGGVLVVKCQDEVSANKQWLTHAEILTDCGEMGYYCKDLFVVVRTNRPVVATMLRQRHARKNHSYFLVLVKRGSTPNGRDQR